MTHEQSRAMFRDECFQDDGTARQQAARGTYDPGYLNYTLGKLMIRKLRDDWMREPRRHAAWQDFHDRFWSTAAHRFRSCAATCSTTTPRRFSARVYSNGSIGSQDHSQTRTRFVVDAYRSGSSAASQLLPGSMSVSIAAATAAASRRVVDHHADLGVQVLGARIEVVGADVDAVPVDDQGLRMDGEDPALVRAAPRSGA